jgi:hypothetical protein
MVAQIQQVVVERIEKMMGTQEILALMCLLSSFKVNKRSLYGR